MGQANRQNHRDNQQDPFGNQGPDPVTESQKVASTTGVALIVSKLHCGVKQDQGSCTNLVEEVAVDPAHPVKHQK